VGWGWSEKEKKIHPPKIISGKPVRTGRERENHPWDSKNFPDCWDVYISPKEGRGIMKRIWAAVWLGFRLKEGKKKKGQRKKEKRS